MAAVEKILVIGGGFHMAAARVSGAGAAQLCAGRAGDGDCYDGDEVAHYMREAVEYSQERPVLVDHFLENAVEVDVDALCDSEDVIIAGIMQHIEEAGIHSGDSSCVLPAVSIREETLETLRTYTRKLALALKVVGLVNLQFAIQRDAEGNDHVYIIEVNPRASRTVPYVSKATGIPLAKIAARMMTGRKLRELLPKQLPREKIWRQARFTM